MCKDVKRHIRTKRGSLISGGSESEMIFCHQTFAMTGALAWQVTQNVNKNMRYFGFGGEIARGFTRVLPPWCGVSCVACAFIVLDQIPQSKQSRAFIS